MNIDSVTLSTRKGLGSIYNKWRNEYINKRTNENFKTYVTKSNDNLFLLEELFTDYGHKSTTKNDTFERSSMVELKNNKLLFMDPDEAKAYILDLSKVDSNSEEYELTVFEPDKNLQSADQLSNVMDKVITFLGSDGVTQDGTKIDRCVLADLKKNSDDSTTDKTYTSGELNFVSYQGIRDVTSDSTEYDYYKNAFEAIGVDFEEGSNTAFASSNDSVLCSLNNRIRILSNIMKKSTTATDDDKLTALQIVREMSTFEYELLEKVNSGFTQAFNTFIGDAKYSTYNDRNGNSSALSTTISYESVMQEKKEAMGTTIGFLSSSDRAIIDKYIGSYVVGDKLKKTLEKKKKDSDELEEGTKITRDNINQYLSFIYDDINNNKKDSSKCKSSSPMTEDETRLEKFIDNYKKAKNAANAKKAKSYSTMSSTISQTVTTGISQESINEYINKLKTKSASSIDEYFRYLVTISNLQDGPEIISRIFENNKEMEDLLNGNCAAKGGMTVLNKKTGKTQTGALYNEAGQLVEGVEYNATNIVTHLKAVSQKYYANKTDDTSAVNAANFNTTTEVSTYSAQNGNNDKNISDVESAKKTNGWAWGIGGIGGVVGLACSGITTAIGGGGLATFFGWNGFTEVAAATGGAVGFGIFGALVGGAIGLGISNTIIKNTASEKYQFENGTFNYGKARWVKSLSTIAGAAFGLAGSLALATGPVGPIVSAIVGGLCWGVAALVHYLA